MVRKTNKSIRLFIYLLLACLNWNNIIIAQNNCEGVPNPGKIEISREFGCEGYEIELRLSSNDFDEHLSGIIYNWQKSKDSYIWSNISNANKPDEFIFTSSEDYYFRLKTHCLFSEVDAFSNIIEYKTELCSIYKIDQHNTVNTCLALFTDSGGEHSNYSNSDKFCTPAQETQAHGMESIIINQFQPEHIFTLLN